jgi:hypothetical protein
MDPLVLLFLSKTEKVEEFLENNNFALNLGDLSELDELGLTSNGSNSDSSTGIANSTSLTLNGQHGTLDMLSNYNSMDMLNNNQPRNMMDDKMMMTHSPNSQPPFSIGSSGSMGTNGHHVSSASGPGGVYSSYGRLEESSPEVSSTDAHSVYSFGSLPASSPAKGFDSKLGNKNLNEDFWDLDISGTLARRFWDFWI